MYQALLETQIGCAIGIEDESFLTTVTLAFSRMMFDFDRERKGQHIIVVDGDDTVWRYDEKIHNICTRLGIDPSWVVDHGWEPVSDEEFERPGLRMQMARGLLKGFQQTTGVKRPGGERQVVDLDVEQVKWSEKYGEAVAKQLRRRVDDEMADWEYLVQFKI
ncbi:hypothetical protein CLAFUW4_05517 [Fulvia fulva]|uniref:Uncharacterized protein n=1 Tax=Passalora fulva TaxID=5499 RepID=A0A9Q8LHW0_PASFU|nr:uncharacterized protein CLAFUR5_05658 [Fulvia fulva]KAK4623634.1 hypothetical protein CLAFUR4_05511 [Fulvia fulva]KAK4624969.1 hypothetical protein CLAFUR0_05519 [Fulvia fulva]UJO17711.1 hypothetical protein CLAFUR5_05658 [Fulvia fulva]WPV14669.1 hypothetical protein CLAFUW4_05517 [Fulvia fulva]WPV29457.1 hypothetical protein CLAFUW7_05515 [Fulvia fulva]